MFAALCIACSKEEIKITPAFLNEVAFVRTVGGTKNEVALSVTSTTDGGYAILGYTQSNDGDFTFKNNTGFDYVVLKYDANDELQWKRNYGGSNDDRGSKIITTNDGGYAILGYTKSNDVDVSENFGDKDFWLVKLDAQGNILSQKSFGFTGKDVGTSLLQTKDNGYLLVGELDVTASGGAGRTPNRTLHAGGDFWAIKLNSSGEKEWSNYYGGTFTDTASGIVETKNGDYIIAGTSDSSDVDITNNKGTYDFWVIKINATGTLIWEKNFGGSEIDEAKGIASTNDNNFIIVGNTRSTDKDIHHNFGGADICIVKIDGNGSLLLQKNLGGSNFDVGNSIVKTPDGNFLISGSSRSTDQNISNHGQNDAWLLKVNSEGNLLWQKTIGGSEIDFCFDALELLNGNIIGVGESTSNNQDVVSNQGFSDLLIIKLK